MKFYYAQNLKVVLILLSNRIKYTESFTTHEVDSEVVPGILPRPKIALKITGSFYTAAFFLCDIQAPH